MAAAAEARVQVIPELADDAETRERAAEFIGAVATGAYVEAPTRVQPIESLHHAIQLAAETGDEQARAMVEINTRTDAIERTMKAGHITKVDLMFDEAGKILQHRQTLESVQANALRFAANSPQMRGRTEAETRNSFRLQRECDKGSLKDYYFVVFSRTADNMSLAETDKAGFFTDTMSCSIQLTDMRGGILETQTGFVAGVEQPGEARHDAETTVLVAARFGIDFAGLSATEILDTPLLIPKSLLPNGVVDLVKRWDGVRGTFFGQAKPHQDYEAYMEVCREREERFEYQVQRIVNQLVEEASSIYSPVAAAQRLNELSAKYMLEQAIGDEDIDPRVFRQAAPLVDEMRRAHEEGRPEDMIRYYEAALMIEGSNSCPGGIGSSGEAETNNGSSKESTKSCSFISKECPKCHKKNVKTTVTAHSIHGSCGCSVSK